MSIDEKRKVKSFSLNTDEDRDILRKLENVDNVSEYIKKLIRNDINCEEVFTKEQRKEVEKIIYDILKSNKIDFSTLEEECFDKDAIDALDQF